MSKFKNKTVWITGASDGIGKELAVQLAAKGARIVLTARNKEKLEAAKASLQGGGHVVFPMDLLKTDAIPEAVEQLLGQVGEIDVLVNNAGISQRSLTKDTSLEVDRKMMELDFFAVVILTKALLPQMLARKSGQIVTISSVAGIIGVPMRSAYCAAKHAVKGFMGCLRAESFKDNIEVIVVTPGSIKTNISKNALEGDGKEHGVTDPAIANGIPVAECARKIIRGMEKGQPEILIANSKERMAVLLRRFAPSMLFKMVRVMKAT